jgi:EAL domain-containing protein (putative c-di-GMP-specific phosphodiesterase class I)
MGKRTVAEFVESDEIIAALSEIGVDFAQGYAVGRPEPFDIYSEIDQRNVA